MSINTMTPRKSYEYWRSEADRLERESIARCEHATLWNTLTADDIAAAFSPMLANQTIYDIEV